MVARETWVFELARRDRIDPVATREHPSSRPRFSVIVAQQAQEVRRQHDLPILTPLTVLNSDQHPVTVDIAYLQMRDLTGPQSSAVGNAEGCAVP